MNKIIQHIWDALKDENSEVRVPVFDSENPIRSTSDMRAWYTSKPAEWVEAVNAHGGFGNMKRKTTAKQADYKEMR